MSEVYTKDARKVRDVAKGLHIEMELDGSYSLRQSNTDSLILKSTNVEDLRKVGEKLSTLTDWNTHLIVVEFLKVAKPHVYTKVKKIIDENNIFDSTVQQEVRKCAKVGEIRSLTYQVEENGMLKLVDGLIVTEGLAIHEEADGEWTMDHLPSKNMLSVFSSKEVAMMMALHVANLLSWEKENAIGVISESVDVQSFLGAVKSAAESKEELPLATKELEYHIDFLQNKEANASIETKNGYLITEGLALYEEPNGKWIMYHSPSKSVLNSFGSKEVAIRVAVHLKNFLPWEKENAAAILFGSGEIQAYLNEVEKAAQEEGEIPKYTEELEYRIMFLQNEDLTNNWPIFKEALDELNSLVGLENVKEQIAKLIGQVRGRMRNRDKVKAKRFSMHMVFAGPPGTGKTEVARIVSKLFFSLGYLRDNKCLEVDRSNIVGSHVGQTEENMKKYLDEAMGGVLFIDEAYALAKDGGSNDFGQEAIDVLIKSMEDNREDIIVILAGYANDMERLLDANEGFRSRVRRQLYFRDYTPWQLTEIGMRMIKSNGYECHENVHRSLERAVESKAKHGVLSGNARDVRNMVENILDETLIRIGSDSNADSTLVLDIDVKTATKPQLSINDQEGLIAVREQALQELESLIGMEELKEEVKMILNRLAIEKIKFEEEIATEKPRLHMVFAGPSGTGKTTVAKIIGKFLKGTGILSSGQFRKVTRSDLVGAYQGQTAKAVKEQVNKSIGGVMLIDEAYNLINGKSDTFGQEAVAELIDLMEEKKDDLVVILAGYEGPINELFSYNEGFRSRIAHHFVFPNYNVDEITKIVTVIAKKNQLHMDEEAEMVLSEEISKIGKKNHNEFEGNGRWASNFVAELRNSQTTRLTKKGLNNLEREDLVTLTIQDIKEASKNA